MSLIKIQENKPNLGMTALRNLVNIRSFFSSLLKIFSFPHRQGNVVLTATNQAEASSQTSTGQAPTLSQINHEEKIKFINQRAINNSCLPRPKTMC